MIAWPLSFAPNPAQRQGVKTKIRFSKLAHLAMVERQRVSVIKVIMLCIGSSLLDILSNNVKEQLK